MDPFRIVIRVLIAYVFMLVLLRVSGKRTVRHATPFDFVMSLIVGDLFDDLFWAEVSAARFFVATGVLTMMHLAVATVTFLSGRRTGA